MKCYHFNTDASPNHYLGTNSPGYNLLDTNGARIEKIEGVPAVRKLISVVDEGNLDKVCLVIHILNVSENSNGINLISLCNLVHL